MGINIDSQNVDRELKFSNLFLQYGLDALISKEEYEKYKSSADRLREVQPKQMASLDKLNVDIIKFVTDFNEQNAFPQFDILLKDLSDYMKIAFEKYKKKLNDDINERLAALETQMNASRVNIIKNVQAFFSGNPIPVIDYTVNMKLNNDRYESTVKYVTYLNIEYEFNLNPSAIPMFQETLKFSELEKNIKIPIYSGKNWTGKDAQIDYEKIDKYYLTSANINKGTFTSVFEDPDSEGRFTFILSRGDESTFLSVEYHNEIGDIDITGNPTFTGYMENQKILEAISRLYGNVMELENYKVRISGLRFGETDCLSTISIRPMFKAILEKYMDTLRKYLDDLRTKDQNRLSEIGNRLKLAGSIGEEIGQMVKS
ncbi:hypothetical protein [Caldiplasma sukawensis]